MKLIVVILKWKIIHIIYLVKLFCFNWFIKLECNKRDFICNNGQCIEENFECDGIEDCLDGSDEHCTQGIK